MPFGPVIDGILVPDNPSTIMANKSWRFHGGFTNGFLARDAAVLLQAERTNLICYNMNPPNIQYLYSFSEVWRDKSGKIGEYMEQWFPPVRFPETVHTLLQCKLPSTDVMKIIYNYYKMADSRSLPETRKKLIQVPGHLQSSVIPIVRINQNDFRSQPTCYSPFLLSEKLRCMPRQTWPTMEIFSTMFHTTEWVSKG